MENVELVRDPKVAPLAPPELSVVSRRAFDALAARWAGAPRGSDDERFCADLLHALNGLVCEVRTCRAVLRAGLGVVAPAGELPRRKESTQP